MTQVAILGAGIAGLSSAWLLSKQGVDFLLFEKQAYIGGLARSFQWHGFSCDFAAHRLFTTDEVVLQQLLNLVPMGRHVRRSKIYLSGHWMRDPLDVMELFTNLPLGQRIGILWHYLARPRQLEDDNFEHYVLRRYGKALHRLFFKPYTEKLFGIPGNDISVYWARQKVRLASPLDHYRENTKTKFQYFYYPIQHGYGAIAKRLYEEVQPHVLLETQVTGFEIEDQRIRAVQYQKDGEQHSLPVEHVISTLPLPITGRMLGHTFQMNYRKVDAVYLLVERDFASDYHWIYFVDSDIAINRMVEFKNMSPVGAPEGRTVLCAEVTQDHPDPVGRVIDDLDRIGLVQRDEILDSMVIQEKFAYPVYDQYFDQVMQTAQETLKSYANLHLVGRAAEFRHREVDDNLVSAIETARVITADLVAAHLIPEVKPIEEEAPMTDTTRLPSICAVILTFNHYADTYDCLQSVQAADYPDLRVVVVDNGSEDGTPDLVRKDFPSAQVIENGQNIGVPAGYNIGFQHALAQGADYILMLNNDTIIPPDMLHELLAVGGDDPQAGIIMPKVLYHGSQDKVWSSGGRYRAFPPAILMTDNRKDYQERTRLIEYAPGCGLLIHRRAFERAGLFDPGYFFLWDDWDFSERVRAHGLNIWYAPNARMWHKVSTTTQGPRSPLFWRTMGSSIARFYRRHGRPFWLQLPVHLGYVVLREFFWKRNWAYWSDFWAGVREGLQKPLGSLPRVNSGGGQI